MIRLFLLIIAFSLITTLGKTQLPSSFDTINSPLKYWRPLVEQPDANLFEIEELIFDYYGQIQHPEMQPDFKSFNRHFMFWKDRVGTNEYTGIGNYKDYILTADHVSKNFTPCASDAANWASIGHSIIQIKLKVWFPRFLSIQMIQMLD